MTYQMRAYRYLRVLFDYVRDWTYWRDVEIATDKVYFDTGERAEVTSGSSRMVIVGKDFVIKWDYDFKNIETIGGCEDEFRIYKRSLSSGYSHLLAPIFRIYHRGRYFFIMPRIDHIGPEEHDYKDINEFTSEDEYNWLWNNIGDLHSWNWGLDNFNNPIVIDYACRPSDYA